MSAQVEQGSAAAHPAPAPHNYSGWVAVYRDGVFSHWVPPRPVMSYAQFIKAIPAIPGLSEEEPAQEGAA